MALTKGIVFYACEGSKQHYLQEAIYAAKYAAKTGLPISLLTDKAVTINGFDFDKILISKSTNTTGFGLKTNIFNLSPYDQTLILDTDALIVDTDLSFAFQQSERHDICVTMDVEYCLHKCQFAKKNLKLLGVENEYLIQYNGGVIFFTKSESSQKFFCAWQNLTHQFENLIPQVTLSVLINTQDFCPFILPASWNYRPHYKQTYFHGDIKIWHSREILPDESSTFFYRRSSKMWNKLFM